MRKKPKITYSMRPLRRRKSWNRQLGETRCRGLILLGILEPVKQGSSTYYRWAQEGLSIKEAFAALRSMRRIAPRFGEMSTDLQRLRFHAQLEAATRGINIAQPNVNELLQGFDKLTKDAVAVVRSIKMTTQGRTRWRKSSRPISGTRTGFLTGSPTKESDVAKLYDQGLAPEMADQG